MSVWKTEVSHEDKQVLPEPVFIGMEQKCHSRSVVETRLLRQSVWGDLRRDAGGWEKEENVGNSLVMGLTVHSRGSWGQVPKTCVFGMITKSPFGWGKFTGRGQCRAGQGQLSKTRVSWKGGWCTSHTRWCLRPCPRPHSVRSFLWTVPASFDLGVFRLNSNI